MKPLPFEAEVRQEAGIVTIVLHGEVNAFAEKALNMAYTEAQYSTSGNRSGFFGCQLYQQHRYRSDRQPVCPGAQESQQARCLWIERSLCSYLSDYSSCRFHVDLSKQDLAMERYRPPETG
jgi:hypothetical protein